MKFKAFIYIVNLFYAVHELLCWFESRDVVCRNGDGCHLGDVPCCFLSPVFDDEAAESTKINWVTFAE